MRALEQLCREEWTGRAPLSRYLPPQPSFTFTQLNILTHFRPKTISSLIKDSPANLIFTLWVNKPVANQALLMKEFCSSIYCEHFCCVLPKQRPCQRYFFDILHLVQNIPPSINKCAKKWSLYMEPRATAGNKTVN